METQSLLSGVSSNSTPLLRKPQKYFSLNTSSSNYSYIESPKCVSFRIRCSMKLVSSKTGTKSRFECRSSVDEVRDSTGIDDCLVNGVFRKRLAVFVSGGGSNFRSIQEAVVRESVHGTIVVLVTNKPDCGGANYARDNGIPVILFPKTKDVPNGLSSSDLVTALRGLEIDFIILAGYLKLISVELIQAYPRSILNIHPSLLPAFGGKGYYGMKVHKAVIASGARYSGPTIHFVDEHYDTGRILAQKVVPVLPNDTADKLAARVLHEEHRLYVEVTQALCEDRIIWREDGVPLIQSRDNPDDYS